MKKYLSLFIIFTLIFAFTLSACTQPDVTDTAPNQDDVQQEQVVPEVPETCPVCNDNLDEHDPQQSISYVLIDGVLTICGQGKMEQLFVDGSAPWLSRADEITKIVIYPGVTTIADNAFTGCENLTELYVDSAIESIGKNAFENCSALVNMGISQTLKTIGEYAFVNCQSLKEIAFADGVTEIGEGAFSSCPALESIHIPQSVTDIGESAFAGCSDAINITVAQENQFYKYENNALLTKNGENLLFVSPAIEEYEIPATVKTIKKHAFHGCVNIVNIIIPESTTHIGDNAFEGCAKLEKVELPENIAFLGTEIFNNCTALFEIIFDGTAAQWDEIPGIAEFKTLYPSISITVIPVCPVCGVTEHTVHPACPECGSYEHLEHPQLIMPELSDAELIELSKSYLYIYYSPITYLFKNGIQTVTTDYKELRLGSYETEDGRIDITYANTYIPCIANKTNSGYYEIFDITGEQLGTTKGGDDEVRDLNGKHLGFVYTTTKADKITNYTSISQLIEIMKKYFADSALDNTALKLNKLNDLSEYNGELYIFYTGSLNYKNEEYAKNITEWQYAWETMQITERTKDKCKMKVVYTGGQDPWWCYLEFGIANGNYVLKNHYIDSTSTANY